jgi:hypothetical protein
MDNGRTGLFSGFSGTPLHHPLSTPFRLVGTPNYRRAAKSTPAQQRLPRPRPWHPPYVQKGAAQAASPARLGWLCGQTTVVVGPVHGAHVPYPNLAGRHPWPGGHRGDGGDAGAAALNSLFYRSPRVQRRAQSAFHNVPPPRVLAASSACPRTASSKCTHAPTSTLAREL